MIAGFELIYSYPEEKKNGLTVLELLPVGASWTYEGKKHEIKNPNKVIAIELMDNSGIALIEDFMNRELNKAYILNGDGIIRWNVSEMLGQHRMAFFSDIYYIKKELFFFININNQDYRFSFDPQTGFIGKLIISY